MSTTKEINLTVSDLTIIEQIISAAQIRGAIRPEEMVPVGQLFLKISNILQELKNTPSSSVSASSQSSQSSRPSQSDVKPESSAAKTVPKFLPYVPEE